MQTALIKKDTEEILVEITFDDEDLPPVPDTATEPATVADGKADIPGPPDHLHPIQMQDLTRLCPPAERFKFNKNHCQVPDAVLLPIQKDLQRKIALANTRMTANTKTCSSRSDFDALIRNHQLTIRQLGAKTKSLVVAQMKKTRRYSKPDLDKVRFAVSKRFTIWTQALEGVLKDKKLWESRSQLWTSLVNANKHQYGRLSLAKFSEFLSSTHLSIVCILSESD